MYCVVDVPMYLGNKLIIQDPADTVKVPTRLIGIFFKGNAQRLLGRGVLGMFR